jgi:cation transport regulator
MSYKRKSDLPKQVRDNLPNDAQDIYRKAFNSAWEQYKDPEDRRGDASREETSHKVAWNAVKKEYEKDDKSGEWKKKDK